MTIQQKIKLFPTTPGVYLMKNSRGQTIYIGKARSLRKRVQSYFTSRPIPEKVRVMLGHVADIDYVQTPTEVDALLLEAQLVNRTQPRYNTRLRDDKSFPFLEVTHEKFPRLAITRRKIHPRAKYYGPYTDARLLREAVRMIHEIFPIRKCRTLCKEPCLYYHLGQCLAPGVFAQNRDAYRQTVENVCSFLEGGKRGLIEALTAQMHASARARRFEEAQRVKDQIEALSRLKVRRYRLGRPLRVSLSASLELKKVLGLKRLPERIVCFDVSDIRGTHAVASRVSFYRELPEKMAYRRYKIHNVFQVNDYAMIQEALERMFKGLNEGRETFLPDLVVIDGGLGHLHAAEEVMAKESYDSIPVMAIAKRFEHLFTSGESRPVVLPERSAALHLVQKIRDEAHRFAIGYHRKLRGQELSASVLDEIPGIGPKRKRTLLEHFQSVNELDKVSLEDLCKIKGMNRKTAERVREFLRKQKV